MQAASTRRLGLNRVGVTALALAILVSGALALAALGVTGTLSDLGRDDAPSVVPQTSTGPGDAAFLEGRYHDLAGQPRLPERYIQVKEAQMDQGAPSIVTRQPLPERYIELKERQMDRDYAPHVVAAVPQLSAERAAQLELRMQLTELYGSGTYAADGATPRPSTLPSRGGANRWE
jgi:hypothetical protein